MALGDMRRALDVVNRDFDAHLAAAQAAGVVRNNLTEAEKDVMRGRLSDTGAAVNEGWRTGSGVRTEALNLSSDEIAFARHALHGFAPQISADVSSAPAPREDMPAPAVF